MKNYLFILSVLLLSSCNNAQPKIDDEDPGYKKVALTATITSVQPMTGMVLWNDMARSKHPTHGQCISLEFSYVQPCRLVTGKENGQLVYDWTYLDDKLSAAASRNHQMVVRFPLCYPSNSDNCEATKGATYVPDYIKALPDYNETYSANPGGDGPTYYPDWTNSELQWFVRQFYSDLAARYNNDPRIAFLEVGFGHWGEYHIYGTNIKFGVNFPTKEYQKNFFLHLSEVLTMPWLVSVDAGDNSYSPLQGNAQLAELHFGLFDDSFMHAGHELSQGEGWNERCWQWSGINRWQTGVCGGEISYYTTKDQREFLNPEGLYGVTWEEAAAKYHMSFIICNDATRGKYFTPERVTEAGLASGYRFAILSCGTNGEDTHVKVVNRGVAPIYRDAYITVDGVRATESLRGLLPGEEHTFTVKAVATADNVTITSDFILSTQQIGFDAE